ncbi:MarR family transcriptional regulator [Cognatiyoonia sp. IB215182]|uniref:MarR family winged helix-turn-helix transcriptional regulator n=1 Tax=Cognatiyoonia sp. IB215182 TaxID=3097353 RepID=UPI002A23D819|nr:MarR family transcriptional regulator [Cognatiyoonia sp. IB215182]
MSPRMKDDVTQLHSAVTVIMRALKIAEKGLQVAHRELNFVPADIQTLRFLATHPACKLSDLAHHLGVVPTTASSIIDRLVDRGLVSRERPESNRRSVSLDLTAAGKDAFSRLDAEEKATMQLMLDALSKEERPAFVRAMSQIAAHVSTDGDT